MAISWIQPSFAGGEIGPSLYGRIDMSKYQVALRKCDNFIVRQYGGVENRPGTKFVAAAKYPNRKCRLIPFQFSTVQTYALEFGHNYMRVIKDGAVVLTTGNAIYELAMPYTEDDLFKLKFTQSADVMTICHPKYPPKELRRYAHDNWQIVDVVTKNGPFEDINVDESVKVYASAETGTITLTASSSIFGAEQVGKLFYLEQPAVDGVPVWETNKTTAINDIRRADSNYYRANTAGKTGTLRPSHTDGMSWDGWGGTGDGDTGIQWEYLHSGFGIARITAAAGTTATATVISRIPSNVVGSTKGSYKWARYAWNSVNGYPSTVVYYAQRLFFAASTAYPQTIWASRTGDYKDFGKNNPTQDDDRIIYTYAGRQVNEIRHLIDVGSLVALTSGGEYVINGDQNKVLTPAAFSFSSQGSNGSSDVPPIAVANIALFVQEKGSVIRDLAYSFDVDGFQGNDLTILANHLFQRNRIIDWSFSTVPYSAAFCVRDDGLLLVMTYLREQQVFAWAPQSSAGKYESTCSISEGNEDAVYFVVNRTINGQPARYIERLSSRLFTTDEDAFFVDSGLSYDGRNTSGARVVTITGGSGAWSYQQPYTLTITGGNYFVSSDVGAQIQIPYTEVEDGEIVDKELRLDVQSVTSGTAVVVMASRDIPAALRNSATTNWQLARKTFSGLAHLEGQTVNILSDGSVEPQKVVTGGSVTLESPGAIVHIGLPITAELETLDININGQETLLDKKQIMPTVTLVVNASRGIFAGTPGGKFYEYAQREFEFYDDPVQDATGKVEVKLDSNWDKNGRVKVKQTDPLPLAILAIIPRLTVGGF
ncbi:phage tail protein [Kosakonia cowanii]